MSQHVIIFLGLAGQFYDHAELPPVGSYLETYDPEYAGGMGHATWTTDPAEALKLSSAAEAVALYMSTPEAMPARADGLPNRPLAAYTVTIEAFS